MTDLTCSQVHQLFSYEDGRLFWKKVPKNMPQRKGKRAGSPSGTGYWAICIGGKFYKEHRIVWLMFNGEWPPGELDHADLDKQNNRIENLRLATRPQNTHNQKKHRGKYLKGVSFRLTCTQNPYQAMICIDGRSKSLGCFPTEQAAHNAYCEAALARYGEFFNAG